MMAPTDIETMRFAEDDNPVEVISGPGALGETYRLLAQLGAGSVMFVCGESVSNLDAFNDFVAAAPGDTAVTVFDRVEPDPSDVTCEQGGTVAREASVEAIIGIGGGSSMDAAKAIAAEAVVSGWTRAQDHPGEPTEIPFQPVPVILIPTTAGTASEVTPFSVVTYTETDRKLVLSHPGLYARYALLDPNVLITCPQIVRIAAGMDALTHAIESCVSKQGTAQTRRRALQAIALIVPHLPRVVADAGDIEAQQQLQLGAMIAGLAFSKSRLGIVHAMALPLSALFHVPHGVANTVLLPYGMRFNVNADIEGFSAIATAMGLDTTQMEPQDAAVAAVEAVEELSRTIGAPSRMDEVGVQREAIPQMAHDAMPSAHIACNPRAIELADLINVYEQAF